MDALANIKMIVIDIDGTLLTPEECITTPTLEAVRAAQQARIVVTLATARRYSNTTIIANELCWAFSALLGILHSQLKLAYSQIPPRVKICIANICDPRFGGDVCARAWISIPFLIEIHQTSPGAAMHITASHSGIKRFDFIKQTVNELGY